MLTQLMFLRNKVIEEKVNADTVSVTVREVSEELLVDESINNVNITDLRPILMLAVLFEDENGIKYTALARAYENGVETSNFLTDVLEERQVDEAESDDDGQNEYITKDTDATVRSDAVLSTENADLELSCTQSICWPSYPFIQFALQSVEESTYEFLQTYEDGWYKATMPLNSSYIEERHVFTLDTPFDMTSIHIEPSWNENMMIHQFLTRQDAETGFVDVHICPRYTEIRKPSITEESATLHSDTGTWTVLPGLQPDEPPTSSDDTAEEQESDESSDDESSGLISRLTRFMKQ